MIDEVVVKTVYEWDGADRDTNTVATLRLQFPGIQPDSYEILPEEDQRPVLAEIEKALQLIADRCFGEGNVRVRASRVAPGSIEVWLTLTSIGGGVYAVFKAYEALRKGLAAFIADIRSGAGWLKRLVA